MPNRWESSGRPLFVKTVYVNGNRHAILSQEDPLLRSRVSFFKKASRPNSSLNFDSDMSVTSSESRDSSSIEKNSKPRAWKDLSSELQDCLVKLRLGSSKERKEIPLSPEESSVETETATVKRQKWGRSKKKKTQSNKEKLRRNETKDGQNKDHYRYVYNLENSKGKKNYCFVKISSEPPGSILESVCGSSDILKPNRNNLVISAAFQNLVMSSYKTNHVLGNKCEYFFPFEDPAELYWNSYLARSYFNCLSERVIQWMDLTKKRKRMQNSGLKPEGINERTFLDKSGNGRKKEKVPRKESSEEDVEGEVKGEGNVETVLSVQSFGDFEEGESVVEGNELKYGEAECEGSSTLRTGSRWERKINQEVDFDSHSVTVTCRCEKNERDYANDFEIATEEFTKRNQKSIDKVNVTRTRPVSVRELSPQQQKKTSLEQIAWTSEKDLGRPQLHIFIPTVPSKDPSEDSISEFEPPITEL